MDRPLATVRRILKEMLDDDPLYDLKDRCNRLPLQVFALVSHREWRTVKVRR